MPPLVDPLKTLDTDALEIALEAADALMRHKQFMPRGGLLLMLVSRFRDDTREALGTEPERYPPREKHGRGKVFRSLDELTSAELDAVAAAVGTLLQERFTNVMDDPELPRLLAQFRSELNEQKTERAQIQASIAS
jgi:hypothetical protein